MTAICLQYLPLGGHACYKVWSALPRHAHKTADSDIPCCYARFVCHDKIVNQQCAACSGLPHDDEASDWFAMSQFFRATCIPLEN